MAFMHETEVDQDDPVLHCRPGILAIVQTAALASNLGRVVRVIRLSTELTGRRFATSGFVWEVEAPDAMLWRVGPAHYSARRGPVPDAQLRAIHPWPVKRFPPQYIRNFVRKWKLPLPVPIRDHRVATGLAMLSERLDISIGADDPMRECAAMAELSLYQLCQQTAEKGEVPCEF